VGQTVLVTGGAGAVGHYAVQLAKWGGAKVIATVSSAAKAEQARLAGADLVINYRNEDVVAKAMAFTGPARRRPRRRCRFRRQYRDHAEADGHEFDDRGLRHQRHPHACGADARVDGKMHRATRAGAVRAATAAYWRQRRRTFQSGWRRVRAFHNVAAQFALSDTAQAHLAVEKGDKLGTVIVDCAR
jgi:NADPH2:quinone reductase